MSLNRTVKLDPDLFETVQEPNGKCEVIHFGPIKVRRRKNPAPTLATGRRSRFQILNPEDHQKRENRRARNRAAAERVRLNRLSIEQNLLNQLVLLEEQNERLSLEINSLQERGKDLNNQLDTHRKLCYFPYDFIDTSTHYWVTNEGVLGNEVMNERENDDTLFLYS